MRIAIDLDGTICSLRKPEETYDDVTPLPGAARRIKELRQAGHCIIITTARNMGTCEGNMGRVLKNVGLSTLTWLARHGIEYDELYFGKPNANVYIDDRAVRFASWSRLDGKRLNKLAKLK